MCRQTANAARRPRAVIDTIDWGCDVRTLYADANMGLADRVASGLTWIFAQVESAIILEDDCVADPTFFPFCEELLERYGDDERVMVISGDNFQFGRHQTEYSYTYSRYPHCWGWATWRRAWQYYDHTMAAWPLVQTQGLLADILGDTQAVGYWHRILQGVYAGQINSWAYRWTLTCWLQNGLTILPASDLVSNIGFGEQGTHTKDESDFEGIAVSPMAFPLQHPPHMVRNARADAYTQKTLFRRPSLPVRVAYRLRRIVKSNLVKSNLVIGGPE